MMRVSERISLYASSLMNTMDHYTYATRSRFNSNEDLFKKVWYESTINDDEYYSYDVDLLRHANDKNED